MSHEDDQLRYDVMRWPKWPVRESPWRYALRNAVCEVLDEARDKSEALEERRGFIGQVYWVYAWQLALRNAVRDVMSEALEKSQRVAKYQGLYRLERSLSASLLRLWSPEDAPWAPWSLETSERRVERDA